MDFGIVSYAFSFGAGVLSTLSPCVLPLLPIIIGSSLCEHKLGPLAVAGGMAISFALIGTLLASVGARIGLNQDSFRMVAAIVMIVIGIVLISNYLQQSFATATSSVSNIGHTLLSKISIVGIKGQFAIGLLLGLIWSPCVGPTLGAAITVASQGTHLTKVALMMGVFGLGAGLPIILLGLLSRQAMLKAKIKLQGVGGIGKTILGVALLGIGISIMTGFDKTIEIFLTTHSPEWLIQLTTSL